MRSIRKNSINPIRSVRSSFRRRRERRRGTEDTNIELELVKSLTNLKEGEYLRNYEENYQPEYSKDILRVSSEKAEILVHREGLDKDYIYTI
jgi:hypothetical protein